MLKMTDLRRLSRLANRGTAEFAKTHGTRTAKHNATVFLSHSHKDYDLIAGGGAFLNQFNVTQYVDWLDTGMPAVTCVATALRIKAKIKENSKFILMATPNALASKWVPWELGIADGLKGVKYMAVLPVADHNGIWPGNEYVSMYPIMKKAMSGRWAVFRPGQTKGILLDRWLVAF